MFSGKIILNISKLQNTQQQKPEQSFKYQLCRAIVYLLAFREH
ncbi:hypothetical protein C4J89_4191 [Pseudomonas sp. R4-35-07]|nr:hypothetical protein C4J91_4337 [Pseudomonas sp. R3-52-08]AZF33639.1 hypothetical protein C4J89_4191 [Pseudomonas sp. R4-35-07]AZF54729.1 hypothetical protein C4J85_4271 [Pseudomonas sp. R4-34-07]